MKKFLKKITKLNTREEQSFKRPYIIWYGVLLLVGILLSLTDKLSFVGGEWGILIGSLLAILLVMFIPMGYINATHIKIRHPRPVFVEPRPIILVVWWAISELILVFALYIILNLIGISDAESDMFFSANTFRSTFIIGFVGFAIFCLPFTAYHIWSNTRYRKVIQYGTAAWRRHQK